ncbi:MAG: acyltransferase family protein [Gammaproteobacteria bacterium]|nr:acyltransferase family protein [Gammaproteobacteria bacterium]
MLQKIERIHGLDALRATMMLLGIVIHSAIPYMTMSGHPSLIKDPENTNSFFTMLVLFIHNFRMPVFFVIAGFFGALLFYDRSPKKMILNRVNRVFLPFIAALLFLWPLFLLAVNYARSQLPGDPAINFISSAVLLVLPANTMHLWFLYYLIYFSVVVWALALFLRRFPGFCNIAKNYFEALHRNALIKYFFLTSITFGCLFFMNSPVALPQVSFIPYLPSFMFYIIFYLYGWLLFKSKHLLGSFINKAWLLFVTAVLLFALKYILYLQLEIPSVLYAVMILSALVAWLFVFSMIGLFMRYASCHSLRIRYVSDASYWIYLAHVLLTTFLSGFLIGIDLSSFSKSLIIFSVTSILCFASYHFFVRSTFIGKFLNGRRYTSKGVPVKSLKGG